MTITSGHRPTQINKDCGGAPDSEHLYDKASKGAVDVSVSGADPLVVEAWILQNWSYSVGKGQKRSLGFTHVGIRPD